MNDTKKSLEFQEFLESIGGLENGYFTDRPPITSRYFFNVDDGWLPIVKKCIEDCIAAGWDRQICQVKEKFGGLRFYINSASNEVHDIITESQRESYAVCETCGEPGSLRKDIGWWKTLCDEHHGQKLNKIKNGKDEQS